MGTLIFKKDYKLNLDVLNKCIQGGILNSRLGLMLKDLAKSINADGMNIDELDRHDLFFIPKNESEKILWENLRESAKIQIKAIARNRINGKKGGRPKKSVEKMVSNIGNTVGKNEILIDENFNELPDCEYFNAYKKEFSKNEITKMINWLKKVKIGKKVDYDWIGKQFRNFRYKDTGKIL